MQKAIGYGLLILSMILFFFTSLHHVEYLVVDMVLAVAGFIILLKNKVPTIQWAFAIVGMAVLRFFIYNDFLGIPNAIGIVPYSGFPHDEADPSKYLIYALVSIVGFVAHFIGNKKVSV